MRRAVEHRALMAIAIGDAGLANTSTIAVVPLDRGWMLYAHKPTRGVPIDECAKTTPVGRLWESLRVLNDHRIAHGDLRSHEITVDDGAVLLASFGSAEYGATDAQLQSDIAQLLVTTSALYDPKSAVGAAIDAFGKDTILAASRRLTKSAVPKRIRKSAADVGAVISTPVMRFSARRAPIRSKPKPSLGSLAARSFNWCCSSRWSMSRIPSSAPCQRSSLK